MATNVTNYQCPSCTGPLHYGSESGKLECDYCGEKFEVATIESIYEGREQAAANAAKEPNWNFTMNEWGEDASHIRAYSCPSCGAQLICDETTAATSCPYCNNPTVIPAQLAGIFKPDFVIPFKVNKEAAKSALKNHYKGKKFLPSSFLKENKIDEIKSIYVPFWLFNSETDANIHYRTTNTQAYTDGDENVVITQYYHVVRQGNVHFEKIPVDGSTKMPDAHMDTIEPYDYQELVPFSTAYLPGYLADKYDVEAKECVERANERIRMSAQDALASTVTGYATVTPESVAIDISAGEVKYALLPVWMLNTTWKNKKFLFAMNGQTGKFIGDLPVDWKKFFLWFGGISLPLMVIIGLILFGGGIG